jgi:hypothetical protein
VLVRALSIPFDCRRRFARRAYSRGLFFWTSTTLRAAMQACAHAGALKLLSISGIASLAAPIRAVPFLD